MIIENKKRDDILEGESRIAFAVNTEGWNVTGFAEKISKKYWPELANMEKCELGTVLTKTIDNKTFYALVCYSLEKGWDDQTEIIKKCFDSIETNESIASAYIGKDFLCKLSGSNLRQIKEGIELSEKKIIFY